MYKLFPCKKGLLSKKATFFPNFLFEKFAVYGLDMELEPEQYLFKSRNRTGTGTGTIPFQKLEPGPEP